MDRLSAAQAGVLSLIHSQAGDYRASVDARTEAGLIRRGLVSTSSVPGSWNMPGWAVFTITAAGVAALEAYNKPVRSVGRPRKHPDQAVKQWEYRKRKEAALDDLEKWVGYAAAAGDKLAGEVRSGRTGNETLRNLIEHFKRVAQEARFDVPLFDATSSSVSFVGPRPDNLGEVSYE